MKTIKKTLAIIAVAILVFAITFTLVSLIMVMIIPTSIGLAGMFIGLITVVCFGLPGTDAMVYLDI